MNSEKANRSHHALAGVLFTAVFTLVACGPAETPGHDHDAGITVDAGATDAGPTDAGQTTDAGSGGDAGLEMDVALVRFNSDGTLDTTFGQSGVTWLNFGGAAGNVRDNLYGLAKDSTDRLVLFVNAKGGARNDQDRLIARLTAAGAVDTSFADGGVSVLDTGGLSDTTRNGFVQADGKIFASGYTNYPTGVGTQLANRIVLQRLNADGTADNTFGFRGVTTAAPFTSPSPRTQQWGMVEAYAAGQQSTGHYVTAGYGRSASSGPVDMVSFRFSGTDGTLDETSWGIGGACVYDQSGADDRGRNMVVLPDDRVLVVGSTIASGTNLDAMLLLLTDGGAVDATSSLVDGGIEGLHFGRNDEHFFGVAHSPVGVIAASGYHTASGQDDDSLLYIQPLDGGSRFAGPAALSDTDHDRLWATAIDAQGRVYGAGFLSNGTDKQFVVVRFNADGSKDTTFSGDGIATHNLAVTTGAEEVRGIVIQSDGKIVVAGNAER